MFSPRFRNCRLGTKYILRGSNFLKLKLADLHCTCNVVLSNKNPRVCVVGSGPAGFGISQYLLKNHDTLHVDMLEKYPIPYGLVRFGVSPDHQEVKNCIHGYERLAKHSRFSFFGNVHVGKSVSLAQLRGNYSAVVLCTGSQGVKQLLIPGKDLQNVFSSNEFVGWYNGVPEYRNVDPDLSGDTAVIIGVGNVSLDCARMLLKPHEELKQTDITPYSYTRLASSRIKKVVIVGRRGPMQMACTRKELAEITDLDYVRTVIDRACFTDSVEQALNVKNLKIRKTQRLVRYLMSAVEKSEAKVQHEKELDIKLLRSPIEITGSDSTVDGVILKKSEMSGKDAFKPIITHTEETERVDCSMVITCVGYENEVIDKSIPFADGKIPNESGRIGTESSLYACGWCKSGSKGVLADTVNDCLITGKTILKDFESNVKDCENNDLSHLLPKQHKYFSWDDWRVIDSYEMKEGARFGKIREKLTSLVDMFKVIKENNSNL